MLVEKPLKVNGYDIDIMGIVSNIVYVRWFEDLRTHFLDKYWPFETMLQANQSPILFKTEVVYRHPITIYDKPLGRVWVANLGRAKWEMEFEIESNGRIHCTGKQIGYVYHVEQKKPVSLPPEFVEMYQASLS